jgi:SagB-type dehydrogenase family enzyme
MPEIVELLEPNLSGTAALEKVIAARRSRRDFSSKSLTLEQLGQLAWAAQGQAVNSKYRTVPSAGATYPLELFAVTDRGLFHYVHAKHALEKLHKRDLRSALASAAWSQAFIAAGALTLVFAADFARTTSHYGQRGTRYVYMEAGHAAQNVHLQAEAVGLGSVAVGAFDDDAVSEVLALPKNLEPIYMVVVGYCRR